MFPEAAALKRQCVIHGKPFISTVASARDWIEVERVHAGLAPDPAADRCMRSKLQTLALIAHDAMKPQMMAYADEHFDLLSRFQRRVATGTTGQRLNELAWSRGWPQGQAWVQRYESGPMGGDAQIADLVLERQCQRAIFFEDPHVARQHEADIQLLERAVTTVTFDAVCITSPEVAQRLGQCRRAVQRRSAGAALSRRRHQLLLAPAIAKHARMAKLYFYYSAMNAGKTTTLLQIGAQLPRARHARGDPDAARWTTAPAAASSPRASA